MMKTFVLKIDSAILPRPYYEERKKKLRSVLRYDFRIFGIFRRYSDSAGHMEMR